jgi:hypothetical protein
MTPKTMRVGVLGFVLAASASLGSLAGCAADAGRGEESVDTQASASTCATLACYGPIESEVILESRCADAGIPLSGTLLLEAYPANLARSGRRDTSDGVLAQFADAPTACLETILQRYCAQSPWESMSTFQGCDGQPHRIDISECPATVPNPDIRNALIYEPFAALLLNSGCNAYADVFASSKLLPAFDGVYVAYDPVGSGPHKGE